MAKSVQGNQAAQARMFAHDAVSLVTGGGTLNTSTITNTSDRGVCLYIGIKMASIVVTMESGNSATFKGINAGSFLPLLVTAVTAATPDSGSLADNDIIALY
tara:strand:+ start:1588 stop:1893 length:306 start_codon:yes stop_codon:yes gene_type:complete